MKYYSDVTDDTYTIKKENEELARMVEEHTNEVYDGLGILLIAIILANILTS